MKRDKLNIYYNYREIEKNIHNKYINNSSKVIKVGKDFICIKNL